MIRQGLIAWMRAWQDPLGCPAAALQIEAQPIITPIESWQQEATRLLVNIVRSQAIPGNGGHNNYGRGEKSSDQSVRKIGLFFVLEPTLRALKAQTWDGFGKWRDIVGGCE